MAATDLERLTVTLEASVKAFENQMKKANRTANAQLSKIENRASRMEASLGSSLSGIGRSMLGVGAAIAGSQGARAIAAAAQQYTAMQNALKSTGLEGKALEGTFSGLFQIAQKNGTEMGPLVTLYGRMSTAQKELNASSAEMMQFTEAVSLALKVSGSSTQEASGALLQLSQAMGGGKIQAEEYNSLIDGARPLLQAVAAGMEEAGGSVSKLTALVKDGKVSSEAFFRAALAGMPTLEQQSSKMAGTVDQSINQVTNAFTVLVGKLDETVGASQNAATNLAGVAQVIGQIPAYVDSAANSLSKLQAWLNQVGNNPFWRKLGELAGLDYTPEGIRRAGLTPMPGSNLSETDKGAMRNELARLEGDMAKLKAQGNTLGVWDAEKRISYLRGNLASGSRVISDKPFGPEQPRAVKPIRNADYAVPGAKKKGKSGGGGGKSDEETRYDQVARYIEQLEKSGRILQAEFDTIGKSNAERAKAIELARIGEVTDQGQLAAIEKQVAANEKLREAIEDARRSQKGLQEVAHFTGDQIMNVFDDLIDGSGNLADSIKNVAKSLASAALQAALLGNGPLGNLFGTGGKGGGVGGLIGMLFNGVSAPGKASGGPVSAGRPYIVGERRPELFIPSTGGRIAPRLPGGGGTSVIINNYEGAPVASRTNANGDTQIDIGRMVDSALAERIASGRGMTSKAITARASRANLKG